MTQPSAKELQRRRIIGINPETVSSITSTDFPGHYPGEDYSWNLERFEKNLNVQFHSNEPLDCSFSVVGIDASIANAFRRIMIDEIPTLAIEDVYIYNNTSIVQDEVLAHRLGLIPLKGNKDNLRSMSWLTKPSADEPTAGKRHDRNTLVLELEVECDWADKGKERLRKGESDPHKLYTNSSVYAHQFKFIPTEAQVERFSGPEGIVQPVHPDILVAKLRPGQKIHLKVHACKGIGKDHAKFSPVATASYRLLPHIDIIQPIVGRDAKKFARCFPRGVIGIKKTKNEKGEEVDTATVENPMKDTVSRECLRHDEFKDKVKLGRIRDHFIYRVESTGQWDSDEIFLESVKLLKRKAQTMKRQLDNVMR